MQLAIRVSLATLALVTAATAARAQDAPSFSAPAASPAAAAAPAATGGPRLEALRAGAVAVAPAVSEVPRAPAPMRKADTKRSRSLMILGGAALIGGAIIGGDAGTIIMLGGLGVGLYGLYLHLQ